MDGRSTAYVLFPVLIVAVTIVALGVMMRRRRRNQAIYVGTNGRWPATTANAPGGGPQRRPQRFGRSNTTRPEEGLNELGEAPPPYDGKREGAQSMEMQDLEAGPERLPDYPAAPAPAVTRTESRSG